MRLAAVVTFLNEERYLGRTLDSIAAQRHHIRPRSWYWSMTAQAIARR